MPVSCFGWNGADSGAATGEFMGPFSGTQTWATTNLDKAFLLSGAVTVFNMTLRVNANANTVNGAKLEQTGGLTGSTVLTGLIVFDQATGSFQDLTNRDTLPALNRISYKYTQGDNTFSPRSVGNSVIALSS